MSKRRRCFLFILAMCGTGLAHLPGCDNREPVYPVEGKVLYGGRPLRFGSILFQPEQGPMARSEIASDGTFRLTTYVEHDGAVAGRHRVQVVCCEAQRPGSALAENREPVPGKSYIPLKYRRLDSSGLRIEVKPSENEPIVLDLQ